jgi:hypothetical protein
MENEHKGLQVKVEVKDEINQGELEEFQAIYWTIPTPTRAVQNRVEIFAALKTGWAKVWINGEVLAVEDPKILKTFNPQVIKFISDPINALYQKFTTIPPL